MDQIPETYTADLNFTDFVANIFKAPAQPPHSVQLEFLDEISKDDLKKYLGYFVVEGAKSKYNKELAQLEPREIETLKEYLHSIGWEVDFKIETQKKKIKEIDPKYLRGQNLDPELEIPINVFMIDFFPYDIKHAKFIPGKPLLS